MKDLGHGSDAGCWRPGQSKRHDFKHESPEWASKCCLFLIFMVHRNLQETALGIQSRETGRVFEKRERFIHSRNRERVFCRDGIKFPEVYTESGASVLLLNLRYR